MLRTGGITDGYPQEMEAVRARLDRFWDDLRDHASSFGDAVELISTLREASSGGKMLRPELVVRVHRSLGGRQDEGAVDIAAAFELLHTAFVIHDDVIDRDWVRRGKPNVSGHYRAKAAASGRSRERAGHYGVSAAIIAGDLALNGALRLIASSRTTSQHRDRLLQIMDTAIIAGAMGELADVENDLNTAREPSAIADMHRAKTAVYTFEAPLEAGAVLADANPELTAGLTLFGRHLGVAYQILDDISGLMSSEHASGKLSAADVRGAKQTAVTVHARTSPEWGTISHLFGRAGLAEADLNVIRTTLLRDGSILAAQTEAETHITSASVLLNSFPAPLKAALAPILSATTKLNAWETTRFVTA